MAVFNGFAVIVNADNTADCCFTRHGNIGCCTSCYRTVVVVNNASTVNAGNCNICNGNIGNSTLVITYKTSNTDGVRIGDRCSGEVQVFQFTTVADDIEQRMCSIGQIADGIAVTVKGTCVCFLVNADNIVSQLIRTDT